MNDIERLLAVEEIKNLKARYFRCLDTKDWSGLAAVFAPDAVFDLREVRSVRHPITGGWDPPYGGEPDIYRGREQVMAMIQRAVSKFVTVHHGHMHEITVLDGSSAQGIWAMQDLIINAPGEASRRLEGYGHYHESYVRRSAGWEILSTRITRLYLNDQ